MSKINRDHIPTQAAVNLIESDLYEMLAAESRDGAHPPEKNIVHTLLRYAEYMEKECRDISFKTEEGEGALRITFRRLAESPLDETPIVFYIGRDTVTPSRRPARGGDPSNPLRAFAEVAARFVDNESLGIDRVIKEQERLKRPAGPGGPDPYENTV